MMNTDQLQVLVPYKDLVALLDVAKQYESIMEEIKQIKRELDGCRALISQTQAYAKDIEKML